MRDLPPDLALGQMAGPGDDGRQPNAGFIREVPAWSYED
jgi:hypothetical protein